MVFQRCKFDEHELVKGAVLTVYPGAPHGLCSNLNDEVHAELLAFLKT